MLMVRVDYVSDLHLDLLDVHSTLALYNKFSSGIVGDWLVIAGDTSTSVGESVNFINHVSRFYEYVLVVLGGHDLHYGKLKDCDLPSNAYLLDNRVLTLNGYNIAGSMNWYELTDNYAVALWQTTSPESAIIFNGDYVRSNAIGKRDKDFLESLSGNIDLLITHVPPIHFSNNTFEYRDDFVHPVNLKAKVRYWVCGHQNFKTEEDYNGTKVLSNPLAFPNRLPSFSIRSFTL